MILNHQNGTNLIHYRDSDMHVGLLILMFMYMVALSMKHQIFQSISLQELILLSFSSNMIIWLKKLNLLISKAKEKKQARMELRRIMVKIFTIWDKKKSSDSQIKLTLQ